jgi:hypothetical protein
MKPSEFDEFGATVRTLRTFIGSYYDLVGIVRDLRLRTLTLRHRARGGVAAAPLALCGLLPSREAGLLLSRGVGFLPSRLASSERPRATTSVTARVICTASERNMCTVAS